MCAQYLPMAGGHSSSVKVTGGGGEGEGGGDGPAGGDGGAGGGAGGAGEEGGGATSWWKKSLRLRSESAGKFCRLGITLGRYASSTPIHDVSGCQMASHGDVGSWLPVDEMDVGPPTRSSG